MTTKKEHIEAADKLRRSGYASTETVAYRLSTVTRLKDTEPSFADMAATYLDNARETAPSYQWIYHYMDHFVSGPMLKNYGVEHGTGGWIEFTDGSEIGIPSHGDIEEDSDY